MDDTLLRTVSLSRIFRAREIENVALDSVNLEIAHHELVAIMGPSGCGKSTLMNILGLIDRPTYGKYYFDGREVGQLSDRLRTKIRRGTIGFVFQSFNLIDELNVFENVELPLLYIKMSAAERKQRVNEILERLNMAHRRHYFPQELSGGQQQRVAIARAVVANPGLILADEPTGNLDSKNGQEVMHLLSDLNRQGTTIVIVTHSERDAGYANRVINLFDGKLITQRFGRIS